MESLYKGVNKFNPICPEPECTHVLRLRKLKTNLGFSVCPSCKNSASKPYILTIMKKGVRKCMKCRKDYTPTYREGYSKFFICIEHPWQKFVVGRDVIIARTKPKTFDEIKRDVVKKVPFEAKTKPRGNQNVVRPQGRRN